MLGWRKKNGAKVTWPRFVISAIDRLAGSSVLAALLPILAAVRACRRGLVLGEALQDALADALDLGAGFVVAALANGLG